MEVEGATTWRPIIAAEVRPTALAFHRVHTECGVWVHIERGELALVCWCEWCKDLRSYAIDKGQDSGAVA